mmetsp:Transcript_16735/g.39481  ORF Transcript_16735/g.39481 Transcript_16735/m.39481 type:complete len:544 (-) Transcript_16735:137-1768(-)
MMRRRVDHENGDKRSRRKRPLHKTKRSNQDRHQPILSTPAVVSIVSLCLGAGFVQHHYQASRSKHALQQMGYESMPKPNIRSKLQQQPPSSSSSSSLLSDASLLTPQEDATLERDSDGIRYHLIFSTDCSPYQHWQSYLVYYSAMLVRQPGHVTRIASGCQDEEAKAIQDWFQQHIAIMSTRFHLQLTPHFSSVTNDGGKATGQDYKFFNKPFGLKYWMEHAPQLQYHQQQHQSTTASPFPSQVQDDIVILIDPDMGLMRPITRDFTHDEQTIIGKKRQQHLVTRIVGPGKPLAQAYGFGAQWARLNLTEITSTPDSPAMTMPQEDRFLYYPIGPPYLATVADMYRIAQHWTKFVPKVYEQYPHLLAEMFAACIAAAHVELPHQLISSLMVSDTTAGVELEGWSLIDSIPDDQVCSSAKSIVAYPPSTVNVPQVVHMCQRYGLGSDWFFTKHKIPADNVYDCEQPLFAEPPDPVATLFDFKQLPPAFERKPVDPKAAKRMAFMLCYIYRLLNEAATFYKKSSCGSAANYAKTRSLVGIMAGKE